MPPVPANERVLTLSLPIKPSASKTALPKRNGLELQWYLEGCEWLRCSAMPNAEPWPAGAIPQAVSRG